MLAKTAERYLQGQVLGPESKRKSSMIPVVKAKLLEGKKGLLVGIGNEQSIAWGAPRPFAPSARRLAQGPVVAERRD